MAINIKRLEFKDSLSVKKGVQIKSSENHGSPYFRRQHNTNRNNGHVPSGFGKY